MFAALGMALTAGAACSGGGSGDEKAAAEKKAFDDAAAALVGPVGLISAYRPHLVEPDSKVKYYVRRNDVDRALFAAANEIRHAANSARQNVERTGGEGTKDLVAALTAVTVACTEANDPEAFAKCDKSVAALDAALQK